MLDHKEEIYLLQMIAVSSDERIKSAASLLVKGGTLTGESCHKCGGVQVRFADKITCINCGSESTLGTPQKDTNVIQQVRTSAGLASAAKIIEEKIGQIANEVKIESDLLVQKQKADLLESYLRILEKTKSLIE